MGRDAVWFNIDTMCRDYPASEPLAERSDEHANVNEQISGAWLAKAQRDRANYYRFEETLTEDVRHDEGNSDTENRQQRAVRLALEELSTILEGGADLERVGHDTGTLPQQAGQCSDSR